MKYFFKRYWIPILGALIAIFAAWSPFFLWPSEQSSINWSRSSVVLSAIAFPAIFAALYLTMAQLRKSMAKPELNLFIGRDDKEFGENDKTSIEVNVYKNYYSQVQLYLWIKNIGTSVARTYQIDIEVPSIFDPTDFDTKQGKGNLPSKLIDSGNTRIYPYYNTEKICFVNKPEYMGDIITLGLHNEKYNKYNNEYEIRYRVFGDWSETQEGQLKVIINKQQEVIPHAIS